MGTTWSKKLAFFVGWLCTKSGVTLPPPPPPPPPPPSSKEEESAELNLRENRGLKKHLSLKIFTISFFSYLYLP